LRTNCPDGAACSGKIEIRVTRVTPPKAEKAVAAAAGYLAVTGSIFSFSIRWIGREWRARLRAGSGAWAGTVMV